MRLPTFATLAEYEQQARDLLPSVPTIEDAQLAIARQYDFRDWPALASFVASLPQTGEFEAAVDAVGTGDISTLQSLLAANPNLIYTRSTRITHFDPPGVGKMAINAAPGLRQTLPSIF